MPLWLFFPSSVMSCWERSRVFSLCVWRLWPQSACGTVSQDAEIIQRFRDVCFNAENRNQVPSTISFFANKVIPSPSPQKKNPLEPLRIDKLLILKTLRPRITYLYWKMSSGVGCTTNHTNHWLKWGWRQETQRCPKNMPVFQWLFLWKFETIRLNNVTLMTSCGLWHSRGHSILDS